MVADRAAPNPLGLLNFLNPWGLGRLNVLEGGLLNGFLLPKVEGGAPNEEGGDLYEKDDWCFFDGHSRAMWPCLSQ
jgi:hypothetical protein